MDDRCEKCSFSPTSLSDYCNEHRPGSKEMDERELFEAWQHAEFHDKWSAFCAARAPLLEEIERLKNDLLDALDVKNGNGPTALSIVAADRDRLRARVASLEDTIRALAEPEIRR